MPARTPDALVRALTRPLLAVGAAAVAAAACADAASLPTTPESARPRPELRGAAEPTAGTLLSAAGQNVCADVAGASHAVGTRLIAWPCNGGDNQRFVLAPSGAITAYGGEFCLDVSGAEAGDGDDVIVWPCHGGANQRWTHTAAGELRTAVNGKCLDLWGGAPASGAKLAVYTCHGGANPRWTVADGGSPPGSAAPPAAPRTPAATPGDARATVPWPAPAGGGAPAAYAVTAAPGGATVAVDAPATTATVTGLTNGVAYTFTVVARNAAGSGPASAPTAAVTPRAGAEPAPGPGGEWTHCTTAGNPCLFLGSREVRLGGPNGPYVYQTAYGGVPCAVYGFNNQNPAPGQPLHCDYGPLRTTTLANPMPGMGGLPAVLTVARGDTGGSAPQVSGNAWVPPGGGAEGDFRTTCNLAKFAFDDPIVFPGRPGASHLHVFFGNTAVDANSTPADVASRGNSTCRGGTLNRTAYWAPAVIDSRTGQVLTPNQGTFYYKTGYSIDPATVQPIPAGLRMIAGDMRATTWQDHLGWGCRDRHAPSMTIPTGCGVGDAVRLTVSFPQCWDGVRLDSPDHKSHMAYPTYRNPPQRSTCPASHPVTIPLITEFFDYEITPTSTPASWRLSSDMYSTAIPGGLSAHADWMNGWDPATMRTMVTSCLNRGADCQVGYLGDGRVIY